MVANEARDYSQDAAWACHIYRGALRSFLSRELRRIQGLNLEDVIRRALRNRLRDDFDENAKNVSEPFYAISYSEFPPIMWHYRAQIFGGYFRDNRHSLQVLGMIRDFRNREVEHGGSPLPLDRATEVMQSIADFLSEINEVDARDKVLKKRDELLNPNTVVEAEDEDLEHGAVEIVVSADESATDKEAKEDSSEADEAQTDSIGELLAPGTYKFALKYVHYGLTPRKRTPRFGLLYEIANTGQQVWDNFYLTERVLSRLDWFMSDFGLETDDLQQAMADEAVRLRIRDRLTRLRSRREFELQIVVTEYEGRQRNEVDRWISPDIRPDYDEVFKEVLEDIDNLPF